MLFRSLGSKLDHRLKEKEPHRSLMELYRELLRLRKTDPALRVLSKEDMEVTADDERQVMSVRRWAGPHQALAVFNFGAERVDVSLEEGGWTVAVDSAGGDATATMAGDAADRAVPVRGRSFVVVTTGSTE